MKKALIGLKKGMLQYIDANGDVIPVTVCELGPCVVVQKKTVDKDGYASLKIGFLDAKKERLTKSLREEAIKRNIAPKKVLREIPVFDENLDVASIVTCDIFSENQKVTVTGESKGRGFAGVIKRHGFGGGRATHGSNFHRAPGSIGQNTYPARVWKGKKLPGRHGCKKVTVKNLKILKVMQDTNTVLILGAVPGTTNSIITVREA